MALTRNVKRILYIDDAAFFRRAIAMLFQKNDFEVDSAEHGFQALEMIEKRKYDLIITDYDMPLMNGLELLLVLRHKFTKKELPVIALSANSDQEIIDEFLKFGTNEYMVKSDNLNPLLQKAKELTS